MQFELSPELVATIRKVHNVKADVSSWPAVSHEKIWAYGFQQLLNDAAAPAKEGEDPMPFVQKRLDNLAKGVLRATRIGGGDPVAVEANRIAKTKVLAALKAKNLTEKSPGVTMSKLIAGVLTKYPDIRAQAEINVAGVAELEVEIDLDL